MNNWVTIRKTPVEVYVEFSSTPGDTLLAENIRVATSPEFAVSLDLNVNLRKRNKQTSSYQAAHMLASRRIKNLHMVQIDHDRLVEQIFQAWESTRSLNAEWKLIIECEGVMSFRIRPQRKSGSASLFLNVLQEVSGGV